MTKVNRIMNSHNTDMGNPHAVHDFHMRNLQESMSNGCTVIGPTSFFFKEPHSHSWVLQIWHFFRKLLPQRSPDFNTFVGDSKRLSLCEQYTCIPRNEIHCSKKTANISRQELYHKIFAAVVMPAYKLEVNALRLFNEIKKAKLQRNADCNHLAGEAVYVIRLLQQMPY